MAICRGETSTYTGSNNAIFGATINNIVVKKYNTNKTYVFINFTTNYANNYSNGSISGDIKCIINGSSYILATLSKVGITTTAKFNPENGTVFYEINSTATNYTFKFTLTSNMDGIIGGNQTITLGSTGADSGTTTFTYSAENLGVDNTGLSDAECLNITGTNRANLPIPVSSPTSSTPSKGYFTPQNGKITTTATANGGDFEGIRARAYAVYSSLKNTTAKNIMSDANISSQFNPTTFSAVNFNNYAKPLNAVYNVLNSNSTDSEIVNLNTISSTAVTSAKNRILNNGEYNQYSKILALTDYATILNYWLKDKISSPINWPITTDDLTCTPTIYMAHEVTTNTSHYIYNVAPSNWPKYTLPYSSASVDMYDNNNASLDDTIKSQLKYTNLNLNNYKICHINLTLNVPNPRNPSTGSLIAMTSLHGFLTARLYINNSLLLETTNTAYGSNTKDFYIILPSSLNSITSLEIKTFFNAQTTVAGTYTDENNVTHSYAALFYYAQEATKLKINTLELF